VKKKKMKCSTTFLILLCIVMVSVSVSTVAAEVFPKHPGPGITMSSFVIDGSAGGTDNTAIYNISVFLDPEVGISEHANLSIAPSSPGWTYILSKTEFDIDPGETENVTLTMLIPVGTTAGNYVVRVNGNATVPSMPWLPPETTFSQCSVNVTETIVSPTPPNITSFAPPSPVNDTVCNWRTFNVSVNQTVNVSWYLNDSPLFTNESVTKANCTLHAEVAGEHNVSAIAMNENGTAVQTWVWNVTGAPPVVPPAPKVIQPNGGEEIPGGSVYDIKWSVTKGTYDLAASPITIWYSTNNGGSWTQIATNEPNDGRYSWNVPNPAATSTNCVVKVRARDIQGNTGEDASDSAFTITKTTSSETETIPAGGTGTVEGPPESGTTAEVTTKPGKTVDVTVAYYSENPHPAAPKPAEMLEKYVDISVSDKDNVSWPIYVEMHYTDDEIVGLNESSLGLYHYKDGAWHRCGDTGVNADENYVWANVAKDECAGSPFGSGGSSAIPVPEFSLMGLVVLIGILSVVLAVATLRKK
jgi:hypothetical protein